MDRGTWRAPVYGAAKELDTTERLNNSYCGPLLNQYSAPAVGTEGAQAVRSCRQDGHTGG